MVFDTFYTWAAFSSGRLWEGMVSVASEKLDQFLFFELAQFFILQQILQVC